MDYYAGSYYSGGSEDEAKLDHSPSKCEKYDTAGNFGIRNDQSTVSNEEDEIRTCSSDTLNIPNMKTGNGSHTNSDKSSRVKDEELSDEDNCYSDKSSITGSEKDFHCSSGDSDSDFISTDESNQSSESNICGNPQKSQKKNRITRKPKPENGQRRTLPKTAKEWHLYDYEKKRKHAEDVSDTNPKAKKRPKKDSQKSRKRSRKSKPELRSGDQQIMDSLLRSDAIKARGQWDDIAELDIKASLKKDQMEQFQQAAPSDKRARSDRKALDLASRSFGWGKCRPQDGKWKLQGLASPLHNHQLMGSSWMVRREVVPTEPNGGILADEMGMGKTVQVLTCVVANPPAPDDLRDHIKATLIVVPANVVPQWISEIKKHVETSHRGIVQEYTRKSKITMELLSAANMVVTSYNQLRSQYPSKKLRKDLKAKYEDPEEREEKFADAMGDLLKIKFWRVILDEAHAIKGGDSRNSLACQAIQAKHRWALTGTPLQNSVDEFIPYLKFLQVDPNGPFDVFFKKSDVTQDDMETEMMRLFNEIVLRRDYGNKFMGNVLYVIPKAYEVVKRVELIPQERAIYQFLRDQCRKLTKDICHKKDDYDMLKALEDDASDDSISSQKLRGLLLEQIIRLRQATAHPLLLEEAMINMFNLEEIRNLKSEVAKAHDLDLVPTDDGEGSVITTQESQKVPDSNNTTELSEIKKDSHHIYMGKQLDLVEKLKNGDVCITCHEATSRPCRADCGDIFCFGCISARAMNESHKKKKTLKAPKCPGCRTPLTFNNAAATIDKMMASYEAGYTDHVRARNAMKKVFGVSSKYISQKDGHELGTDIFGVHPQSGKDTKFLEESDKAHPEPMIPSAKITAIKETVLEWLAEAPDDKIVIFTQFIPMMTIVGRMFQDEEIPFIYYYGGMEIEAKTKAIQSFHDLPNVSVLIASLQSCAVGLNLACANRAILVDLWWNRSIEQQAFGRIFRIGQKKEMNLVRIIAKDTIDEHIERLQIEKLDSIGQLMKTGKLEAPKFTTEEMIKLINGDTMG
ncbi:SNF2 family N-terminal domain-containing protein [Xylariales sp. PMI_506]|nr:SNF2 family N-terminal domain-containing protein [Xylariales sp. PMI_506]